MIVSFFFTVVYFITTPTEVSDKNYIIEFTRIDNSVKVIVNDSIVFSSGTIDFNPDLDKKYTCDLWQYLTSETDEVIIQLYNGHEPFIPEEDDEHWEIEYSITKDGKEYELMWDEGDDNQIGLVFEEKYLL